MNIWKQADKILKFSTKTSRNFQEDVFVAWKKKVAFKGGHSIHNRALKFKVLTILDKRRKAAKVKKFRI